MSKSRARILVLTYTPIDRAPRVLKQVRYLRETHDVTTAGPGRSPFDDVPHLGLPEHSPYRRRGLLRFLYLSLLSLHLYSLISVLDPRDRLAKTLLKNQGWDIVIAHDPQTIVVASKLGARHGVVSDLHEYAPRQNEHSLAWRILIAPYFRWLCRTWVPRAAAVVSVSQGIVDEYRREFGFDAILVVNATPYQNLVPGSVGLPLRLVHSGAPGPQRKLETMIDAVLETAADVSLDFYLLDDGSDYIAGLKRRAASSDRIRFNPQVPYSELIQTLSGYDIGISLLAPINFNHVWALPNKFFDYVQARLGVIVGPSPEMARITEAHNIGAVLPDFEAKSLARLLEDLTPARVAAWKQASADSALELSSERQGEIWLELVERLMGDH